MTKMNQIIADMIEAKLTIEELERIKEYMNKEIRLQREKIKRIENDI